MTSLSRCTAALLLAASFLSACKKDDVDPNSSGPVTLEFQNVVGGRGLALTAATYTNGTGETYNVNTLQYYISNISLTRDDGTVYTVPQAESYHLIRQSVPATRDIELHNVPAGTYTRVTFNLGIDSLRSRMPDAERLGDLDISDSATGYQMYWSWNPGYIFYRLEGDAPSAPGMMGQPGGKYFYHIGGYGGTTDTPTPNNNRTVSLSLPQAAEVKGNRHPVIHTLHDVDKVLTGPGGTMSFAAVPMIHAINGESVKVANNYKESFVVSHVHND